MSRKPLLAVAPVAALAGLVLWAWWTPQAPPGTGMPVEPAGPAEVSAIRALPPGTVPVAGAIDLSDADRAFLAQLRERFGPRIAGKHAQIKLIEQLIAYLAAQYPADWRGRVAAFLRELFPERAAALVAQFERLMRHNAWLEANREALLALPTAERRARLWQARHEAFGADAEEIWAAERRGEQVRSALAAAEAATGQTATERFDGVLAAVRSAYGAQADAVIERRQTELLNGFLDLGSVQAELRQALPEQRRTTLRALRSAIGMDDAALARWDALDVQRDGAWDAGVAYLRERDRLLAAGAPAGELAALQDRVFGDEAEVIRAEEAAGFFRYGGERRIGRE